MTSGTSMAKKVFFTSFSAHKEKKLLKINKLKDF